MIELSEKLGVGLGFRDDIALEIEENLDSIDFIEIVGDQFFNEKFLNKHVKFLSTKPIVCHFLRFSLGTEGPISQDYLEKARLVVDALKPKWISDHLAITSIDDVDIGHLSPLLFSEQAALAVAEKVTEIQNKLNTLMLIENIASDFQYPGGTITEQEFVRIVCSNSSCGFLLDLNNLYVNCYNRNMSALEYVSDFPLEYCVQIHVAGFEENEGILVDSHSSQVHDDIFYLLHEVSGAVAFPNVSLERDKNFPNISEILSDLSKCRKAIGYEI